MDACKASASPGLYFLALSALVTGARRGELLGLRWNQVDVEKGEAYLVASVTKTKRARTLIWAGPAFEELHRWAKVDESLVADSPVFPSLKNPRKPLVNLQKYWEIAREAAGDNMRWRDWRHQCGTYLAMSGMNAFMIADVLGHTSTLTTQRYVHMTTESKREALRTVFG